MTGKRAEIVGGVARSRLHLTGQQGLEGQYVAREGHPCDAAPDIERYRGHRGEVVAGDLDVGEVGVPDVDGAGGAGVVAAPHGETAQIDIRASQALDHDAVTSDRQAHVEALKGDVRGAGRGIAYLEHIGSAVAKWHEHALRPVPKDLEVAGRDLQTIDVIEAARHVDGSGGAASGHVVYRILEGLGVIGLITTVGPIARPRWREVDR